MKTNKLEKTNSELPRLLEVSERDIFEHMTTNI